jgi:hypothetical protein
MEETFKPKEYVKYLGEELVHEFSKSSLTTHPHSVSGGRETSARVKLKSILPAGVGVGSGFIIDSFGKTSNQCDIILYEENFALKFIVNEDEPNAYYNCESVIAVGEVKSDATITDVRDAVDKLIGIKMLRRNNDDGYNSRKYFSSMSVRDSLGDEKALYNSNDDFLGQIFTFLLCKTLNTPTSSIASYLKEKCSNQYMFLNRIISTQGDYIAYLNRTDTKFSSSLSRIGSNAMYNLKKNKYSFNYFISDLINFISHESTVPLNYEKYLYTPLTVGDLGEIIDL